MTEELKIKPNDIVVPGEALATGMGFLPSSGTYREGDTIRCARLGMVQVDGKVLRIVPVSGNYLPRKGDTIIAEVRDILISGWKMSTNSPYHCVLPLKEATSEYIEKGSDLTKFFDIGEWVVTKIIAVTSQNLIDCSMRGPGLRKLQGGRMVKITPCKVPRLIGKAGSMVSMIKQHTNCQMIVGQNGMIWIDGEPENVFVAVEAIEMIEKKAHTSGLTDKVKTFLEKEAKKIKGYVKAESKPPKLG